MRLPITQADRLHAPPLTEYSLVERASTHLLLIVFWTSLNHQERSFREHP
jgi:hypothetical protein